MASEIADIVAFLRQTPPFDALDAEQTSALSRQIEVRYARHGSSIIAAGDHNDRLFIVRTGSVELRLAGKELTARLGAGSTFAYPSLLRGGEVRNTTIAIEDSLLYTLPAETFHRLREQDDGFRAFFVDDEAARIRHALEARRGDRSRQLDMTALGDLVRRGDPVTCGPDASIREAVRLMHERNVSTLAICDGPDLAGIFTDKDLRNRVVSKELSLDHSIAEVMTADPRTLSSKATLAEAMAMMASGAFRHIPLLGGSGELTAILSATDILSFLGNNAIDIGLAIGKARDEQALIAAAGQIPDAFAKMVASGYDAAHAMHFTSALGEAAHRRAAELAEAEVGPPPAPYALVVFGSLARKEQLVGSDQDNGLVIDDAVDSAVDNAGQKYFARLGERISDILNACGFVYCKGGIMAKNAEQRLTLSEWRERYGRWIGSPTEDRILRATIFFDVRCVHGAQRLVRDLRREVIGLAEADGIFLSHLARDALRSKVPLGVFRNLVLDKSEDGQKVFDAKAQAVMPIIDIARTQALANGIKAVGTLDRLKALAEAGKMASEDAESLKDAFVFTNDLRIAHQTEQIRIGKEPSNAIAPDDLSPLEREYLKDSFSVIRRALDSLRRNFAGGIS